VIYAACRMGVGEQSLLNSAESVYSILHIVRTSFQSQGNLLKSE
jgi:hypothetical protein